MGLLAFEIIATIVVFCVFALLFFMALFKSKSKDGGIFAYIFAILMLGSLILVPSGVHKLYNKNKVFTDDVKAIYSMLSEENENYISISGGRSSYPYVCYEIDNSIKVLKLDDNVKIIRDSDTPKIEKVITKCGFITNISYIVYLPD